MMQAITYFLLLFALTLSAHAQTGLGKSTYTCIDKDGDSYGVGPGCTAPDADDNDASVQTATQAIAKYGTLNAFLSARGYTPGHIFYFSTTGNDSTGVVDDPSHPYQTWAKINLLMANGTFRPGDILMFRAGTWTNLTAAPISGTAGRPVTLMAYPGETVWIDNTATGAAAVSMVDHSYITIDGLKLTGGLSSGSGCMNGGTNDGQTSYTFHDITIRNVEAKKCGQGMIMTGMSAVTIEDNLIRDSSSGGQHCIYLGSRGLASSNVIVRRNICYNAAWNGFHFNGRFTNLQADQNIIYTTGIAGMSFQEGVSNSFIRNNLIFNPTSAGLEISNYPGDCAQFGQGGSGNICPYDQTGNVFENNTVYETGYDPYTGAATQAPAVSVNNYSVNEVGDLGHNTFRNNILVGYGGAGHYPPVVFYNGNQPYLSTSTFTNNIFWSLDGAASTTVVALGYSSSYGFAGYTCAQAASVTTISGCSVTDPLFTDVSSTYHTTPTRYNFTLQAASPAIKAGTTTDAPAFDLVGATRNSPPTIGGYEAGGGSILPPAGATALTALACSPGTLNPGGTATCTISLSQAGTAPVGVTISSGTPALVVPSSATVPAGSTTTTFSAVAGAVATNQTATITATMNGLSKTASIGIMASATSSAGVASLSCAPTTLSPGGAATCTVTLSQSAGSGGASVAVSAAGLTAPSTVSVAAGSPSASFTVTAGSFTTPQTATVTATLNGMSQTASLSLTLASATALGWQRLTNTALQTVCPPNNFNGIGYAFSSNCHSAIDSWSGAAADTKHSRLIIWGGGHSDYSGDEIYSLNLGVTPATLTRMNDPTDFTKNSGCPDANVADGTPVSRHTYGGLAYLQQANRLFAFGGSKAPCGSITSTTWTLDTTPASPAWHTMDPVIGYNPAGQSSTLGMTCAYDPTSTTSTTESVICNWGSLYAFLRFTYDNATQRITVTKLTNVYDSVIPSQPSTVIDPKRKLMVFAGSDQYGGMGPKLLAVDISSTSNWVVQDWTAQGTGCGPLINAPSPGLAYDPVLDRIVGWPNSGNTVYLLNPDTKTCVAQTFPNGPASTATTGTFGRFQYFPALDAFAVVASATEDAFLLRLSNSPSIAPASACDLNSDGKTDNTDVQLAIDQALGVAPCTTADLQQIGRCTVVGVQRVIASSLGGACVTGN